jgi:hypothetical protein
LAIVSRVAMAFISFAVFAVGPDFAEASTGFRQSSADDFAWVE